MMEETGKLRWSQSVAVGTTAAPLPEFDHPAQQGILLKNATGNTQTFQVGNQYSQDWPLAPGEEVMLPVRYTKDIWVSAGAGGDNISVLVV